MIQHAAAAAAATAAIAAAAAIAATAAAGHTTTGYSDLFVDYCCLIAIVHAGAVILIEGQGAWYYCCPGRLLPIRERSHIMSSPTGGAGMEMARI